MRRSARGGGLGLVGVDREGFVVAAARMGRRGSWQPPSDRPVQVSTMSKVSGACGWMVGCRHEAAARPDSARPPRTRRRSRSAAAAARGRCRSRRSGRSISPRHLAPAGARPRNRRSAPCRRRAFLAQHVPGLERLAQLERRRRARSTCAEQREAELEVRREPVGLERIARAAAGRSSTSLEVRPDEMRQHEAVVQFACPSGRASPVRLAPEARRRARASAAAARGSCARAAASRRRAARPGPAGRSARRANTACRCRTRRGGCCR